MKEKSELRFFKALCFARACGSKEGISCLPSAYTFSALRLGPRFVSPFGLSLG
jgi:hypothetical protein